MRGTQRKRAITESKESRSSATPCEENKSFISDCYVLSEHRE